MVAGMPSRRQRLQSGWGRSVWRIRARKLMSSSKERYTAHKNLPCQQLCNQHFRLSFEYPACRAYNVKLAT